MTGEKRQRRRFTDDFKRVAVALVTEHGYKVSQAARSLDIHENVLRQWKQKHEQEDASETLNVDEREDLKFLRRESRELRMEKDILKKGVSVLRERNEVKYAFIQDHAFKYPVTLLCRIVVIKYSSYYDRRSSGGKLIPAEELQLRRRMKVLFHASW